MQKMTVLNGNTGILCIDYHKITVIAIIRICRLVIKLMIKKYEKCDIYDLSKCLYRVISLFTINEKTQNSTCA